MNVEQRNYIGKFKCYYHLETIKKEHDLEKRKYLLRRLETIDIKKVDENSELFQQILERV